MPQVPAHSRAQELRLGGRGGGGAIRKLEEGVERGRSCLWILMTCPFSNLPLPLPSPRGPGRHRDRHCRSRPHRESERKREEERGREGKRADERKS
jgi:hypothetical protein